MKAKKRRIAAAARRSRARVGVTRITKAQGLKVLDRVARRHLGVSAKTFIKTWNAGGYRNGKRELAERVAIYLAFAA